MKAATLIALTLVVTACTSASEGFRPSGSQRETTASVPDGWLDAACDVGERYRSRLDERVFDAAIPGHRLDAVWRCVTSSK